MLHGLILKYIVSLIVITPNCDTCKPKYLITIIDILQLYLQKYLQFNSFQLIVQSSQQLTTHYFITVIQIQIWQDYLLFTDLTYYLPC